ncbi:MAG: LysM peptidoglycan-binding domain-containing protein [Gammaproteobacteria bacterium]|nr:LysM peptidoglycan-binding domain-containing protein [Gammaproteobacteria bacterium]
MPVNRLPSLIFLVALSSLYGCVASLPEKQKLQGTETQTPAGSDSVPATGPDSQRNPSKLASDTQSLETAAAVVDVWQRMRLGFRLSIPENRRVDRELHWYGSHARHLNRVQTRARPYLFFIVNEVEKRGLPGELALLPMVESAFRPTAYSPSRAAGIWQFMPSTGRMYGLKQTWWYDGRRDVVASTHAALDYLEFLAGRFDGDWELALAAYNAGAANVRRAIKKNRKLGKPTDYWSLDLPRETRTYVPRLLATAKMIANPEAYGIHLDPIPNKAYFNLVKIDTQTDLNLVAGMAELPFDELRRLNPGFHRWATDPEGPHHLYLPVENIPTFVEKWSEIPPEKRLPWIRYRVKSGDNLGSIAQRFNISVRHLKQSNSLRTNRIRAGSHLLIPNAGGTSTRYASASKPDATRGPTSQNQSQGIQHTVRSGDNLWTLARSYRVSHKALANWNGISTKDTLHPGQILVIPAKPLKTGNSGAGESGTRVARYYEVRKGDSLARIADRFDVSVRDLRKWNMLSGKYIQPGQKIRLNLDVAGRAL